VCKSDRGEALAAARWLPCQDPSVALFRPRRWRIAVLTACQPTSLALFSTDFST